MHGMPDLGKVKRRIYANTGVVHEVDMHQYQIGESMTFVSLMCGTRVQRWDTRISEVAPNCLGCLAHEDQR